MNEKVYIEWCEELYQKSLKVTHPDDRAKLTKRYKKFLKGDIKDAISDTEADIQTYWM